MPLTSREMEKKLKEVKEKHQENQRDQATSLDSLQAQLKKHVKLLRDWRVQASYWNHAYSFRLR